MNNSEPIKYFAYCRKSSEDGSRQIASINDQVNAISKIVESEGLNLVAKPFTEEKSSKAPGRPVFNEMLDRIDSGEANAVLCWDIDRLYRNPVDEGRLRWLLQKGVIKVIRTPYRSFYPDDAGLLMGVEGGRATDYVIRLSKNVRRGLQSRVSKGWRPSRSPIGYENIGVKGDKQIVTNEKTFPIIREIWDNILSGGYSVRDAVNFANNKRGLRTTVRSRSGGRPLSMAQAYKMLVDPFYYGMFFWNDEISGKKELIKGNHQAVVTENEFNRVQIILGRKGKAQPKTKEFAFTGLIRCGECNSSVTAEEKRQVICTNCKSKFSNAHRTDCPKCHTDILEMDNPTILNYTYYHCTKRVFKTCTQRSVHLKDLESQFLNELEKITIDQEYLDVALDYLAEKQKESGKIENVSRESLQKSFDMCQKRLLNLNMEFTSPQNANYKIYSQEEFIEMKGSLMKEKNSLYEQISSVNKNFEYSLDESRKVFEFCAFAKHHFNTDDLKKKRAIFSTIGSNITLKDKKLNIQRLHPYLLIENELKSQRALNNRFEHKETAQLEGGIRKTTLSQVAYQEMRRK